ARRSSWAYLTPSSLLLQYSNPRPSIERSTPCLLGLYSLVVLLGHALHLDGQVPVQQAAWYPKTQSTFIDVLATVRRHLWGGLTFQTSASHADLCLVPRADLARLLQAACY